MARTGLYARKDVPKTGEVWLFLLFKENDLHTGIAPTIDKAECMSFLHGLATHLTAINRTMYVIYPNKPGCQRKVPVVVTPFSGKMASRNAHKQSDRPFHSYQESGLPALGDNEHVLLTRVAWELYYESFNAHSAWGIFPVFNPNFEMLLDGELKAITVDPPPFHPFRN